MSNSVSPWTAAHQASLSITNSWSLLKLMSIELVMLSNHLILCYPLLLLLSIFPSIRIFSNELAFPIKRPEYWSFRLASVLPVNIQDWFPLGLTSLISLLSKGLSQSSPAPQFKSISSLMLSLLMLQLSHSCMTTRKTIALTRWTLVGKVMSVLFHMLSRLVISFLPKSKHLLI